MNEEKLIKYRSFSEWYAVLIGLIGLVFLFLPNHFCNFIGFGLFPACCYPLIVSLIRRSYYNKITETYRNSKSREGYIKGLRSLVKQSINMVSASWIILACGLILEYFNHGNINLETSVVTYLIFILPFLYFEGKILHLLPK